MNISNSISPKDKRNWIIRIVVAIFISIIYVFFFYHFVLKNDFVDYFWFFVNIMVGVAFLGFGIMVVVKDKAWNIISLTTIICILVTHPLLVVWTTPLDWGDDVSDFEPPDHFTLKDGDGNQTSGCFFILVTLKDLDIPIEYLQFFILHYPSPVELNFSDRNLTYSKVTKSDKDDFICLKGKFHLIKEIRAGAWTMVGVGMMLQPFLLEK